MTTVREICEKALSHIGAFTAADDAPDPRQMEIAAGHFADLTKHIAATGRRQWLVAATFSIPLEPSVSVYSLIRRNLSSEANETLATEEATAIRANDVPEPGIMFVISAMLRDGVSNRESQLKLIQRWEYDELTDKTREGTPTDLLVDQLNEMTCTTYPVPPALADPPPDPAIAPDVIRLRVQRLTLNTRDTDARRELQADIMAGFELWASMRLATIIGAGPVMRLPTSELNDRKAEARGLWDELTTFADQETNRFRRTAYNDLG